MMNLCDCILVSRDASAATAEKDRDFKVSKKFHDQSPVADQMRTPQNAPAEKGIFQSPLHGFLHLSPSNLSSFMFLFHVGVGSWGLEDCI
jgi:hypothetical protein